MSGRVQVYPWSEGALYRLYTAPGADQRHRASAGREPGLGRGRRHGALGDRRYDERQRRRAAHAYPRQASWRLALRTNLVIATDRRVYHVEALEHGAARRDGQIPGPIPQDALLALQRAPRPQSCRGAATSPSSS